MPFDSKTAAAAGSKGGKKTTKDPATIRTKSLRLVVAQSELDMIDKKATAANISRTEFVVRAAREYDAEQTTSE